ncbi:MAG: hypothetical protein IKR48_02665 [Kiritimatiellae bacterium]|nr:hypothetical protein [Kiritimatiellia bacterium]
MITISVRVGDRGEKRLTAIDASKDMISYTYDRVHDKTLPKSDRWLMAKTIWDDASMARALIVRSNGIKVENKEEAEERILMEKQAVAYLDSLNSNIDLLHIKGIISDDRAEFWTGLVTKTQNLTKARLKANKNSYKELLNN